MSRAQTPRSCYCRQRQCAGSSFSAWAWSTDLLCSQGTEPASLRCLSFDDNSDFFFFNSYSAALIRQRQKRASRKDTLLATVDELALGLQLPLALACKAAKEKA